jgi:beta-glucosidase
VPLAAAATFDSAAVANAARVAAAEAAAAGLHWTFAPMVDVARDPRWGRVVEGAGEDPFLGSVMAAAQVRGFQGDPAHLAGAAPPPTDVLLATVKHFAGYGFAEGGRDYNTVELTERTLWDVVLPPFEAAIRAGAATLMAAFNEVGGTPAHASRFLLQDVLRDRWRFGGLVVSDWTGVAELIPHGLGDSAAVAARALAAGVDVEMSSALYRTTLGAQLRAGRVPRPPSTRRWCACSAPSGRSGCSTTRTATATPPAPRARCCAPSTRGGRARRRPRGDRAAREPADRRRAHRSRCGATCARWPVVGPLADDAKSALGGWWGAGRPEDAVTPLAGLRARSRTRGHPRARRPGRHRRTRPASPPPAPPPAPPTPWCSCSASGRT